MYALLCIFNPFASGTDFYGRLEREREAYLSEKSMTVFLYNKLLLRNATKYVLLLAPEYLKWNLWKKGHFYILFTTLMYWLIGRSIHDWAKVTEQHSWCIYCNEVASYNIINSDRTKRNSQFCLEVSKKIRVLFPERIKWFLKNIVRFL